MNEEKKKGTSLKIIAVILIIATIVLAGLAGKIKITPTTPDNYAPEIKYHYDTYLNSIDGYITLVVGVEDRDGDKMDIQFWLRENSSREWIGIGNFEGFNGSYHIETDYIFNKYIDINSSTCYWKVEISDHKEITKGEYTFLYNTK